MLEVLYYISYSVRHSFTEDLKGFSDIRATLQNFIRPPNKVNMNSMPCSAMDSTYIADSPVLST